LKNDQNLISKISAWQYAPGDGAGKNRTPRWQPEKLQP
jgi:hypothetical protein